MLISCEIGEEQSLYSQLKEISQIIKSKKKIHVKTFKDMTPQTIDPRKWKK